jgi:hypothetical protein
MTGPGRRPQGGIALDPKGLEAHTMQVPSDLASRLLKLAVSSRRSPEALLREAISRLIVSTEEAAGPSAQTFAALGETPQLHSGFVPQPQSFSVYE